MVSPRPSTQRSALQLPTNLPVWNPLLLVPAIAIAPKPLHPAMGLLSILPESFAVVETWITRLFLFLGLVAIGPWAALLIYDLLLYICRALAYEIPFFGGRARGKARPRAPSLTERPSGRRRRFSLARRPDEPAYSTGGPKADMTDARYRHITEEGSEDSSTT